MVDVVPAAKRNKKSFFASTMLETVEETLHEE
jgi:hypothetical protein